MSLEFSTLVTGLTNGDPVSSAGIRVDSAGSAYIEGAYVMALYLELKHGDGVSAHLCVRSKGMYTGKDGSFRFPIEKQDGLSPVNVEAIHVDYYVASARQPLDRAPGRRSYQGIRVEMEKQRPPNWIIRDGSRFSNCRDAKSRSDAEASAQYFRIQLEQWKRLGAAGGIETTSKWTQELESMDGSQSRARR
jgi:hypothetical protein